MFGLLGRPRGVAAFAAASAIAIVASASSAMAQEQVRQFDIPAQSLSSALREFSRQADVMVVADGAVVNGRQAPAVEGSFTPSEALRRLLAGSGLNATPDANGRFILADSASPMQLGAGRATAPSEAADEEIVVTGTRIRAGDAVASPVYTLDRDDFAAAGANSVQQVLRTMPQNFTGGSSETSAAVSSTRNGADFNAAFGAGVNLRGLGTESTLVLLNGRRMAPGGFGNLTDISTIPLSAIERVEVMPDGASAVYGSDAVGGVVNFVLREDFQGAETRFRYGAVTDGGLRQTSISQVLGAAWTTGSVLLDVDYGRNEPLLARDRPFATGLQDGEVHLSPEDERIGFLVNGRQELSPDLTLSAVAYGVARDASVRSYDPFSIRQDTFAGTTTQFGGTMALDWRFNESWTATLAYTQSQSEVDRRNFLGATDFSPEFVTFATATHDASAIELELEGVLFTLPGGEARLAVGAEQRTEELSLDRSGFASLDLEREVSAGYAELYVPLIGAANANALAHRLSFTLAGRYEDYDDVGSADTYKIGGLWSPIEHVNLRATYGTSFRAPYLYQYDPGLSIGLLIDLPDPTAMSGWTRTAVILQMADPELGPENATIWSAGFDVTPQLFGVRISGTYFDIAYEDRISVARFDFDAFTNPELIPLISTPPDPELVALLDEVVQFANFTPGDLSTIEATFDGRTRNQASTEMTGVDLVIGRDFETDVGVFDLGLSITKLLTHDVRQVAGAPAVDILDTIFNPVDLRARASLTWQSGGWSAAAFVNYTDEYDDRQIPGAQRTVASWTTVDLGVGYTFQDQQNWLDGTTLRLNVINAFDEDPPRITDFGYSFGDPGYDTENANPIGRLIAFEVSKRW